MLIWDVKSKASSRATGSVSGASRTQGSKAKFSVDEASKTNEAKPLSSITPASIDPIMASFADEHSPQRRYIKRGVDLLDDLEQIRLGLISGSIEPEVIKRLSDRLKNIAVENVDPKLGELLLEIETRAAVELAKREVKR
jgi:hypothetical protein